jgi:hypothetical protein
MADAKEMRLRVRFARKAMNRQVPSPTAASTPESAPVQRQLPLLECVRLFAAQSKDWYVPADHAASARSAPEPPQPQLQTAPRRRARESGRDAPQCARSLQQLLHERLAPPPQSRLRQATARHARKARRRAKSLRKSEDGDARSHPHRNKMGRGCDSLATR